MAHGVQVSEAPGDPYRSHLLSEAEKETQWRHGAPPTYEGANKFYEETRTKVWLKGSLEEIVQNLVKSWEMELSHKTRMKDFKTINHDKFRFSVNGAGALTAEETLQVGSYNALLATALPEEHQVYKPSQETFESSHDVFREVFPSGFAWEVLQVYSGPPVVAFKWRHWGLMEGTFKGHAPSGEVVEMTGTCTAEVDENLRIGNLEVYYDPAQLLGPLLKGRKSENYKDYEKGVEGCPFARGEQASNIANIDNLKI